MLLRLRQRRGVSLSLVGLLIVALIIGYLFIKMMTSYLGRSPSSSVQAAVAQTGVAITPGVSGGSVAQATGVLEWSRQEIKEAGRRDLDRAKDLAEYNFN